MYNYRDLRRFDLRTLTGRLNYSKPRISIIQDEINGLVSLKACGINVFSTSFGLNEIDFDSMRGKLITFKYLLSNDNHHD